MGPKLKGRVPTGSWNSQALTPEFYFYQLSFASSASPSLPATNSQSGGVSRCGALQCKCKHIFYNEHMGSSSWRVPIRSQACHWLWLQKSRQQTEPGSMEAGRKGCVPDCCFRSWVPPWHATASFTLPAGVAFHVLNAECSLYHSCSYITGKDSHSNFMCIEILM